MLWIIALIYAWFAVTKFSKLPPEGMEMSLLARILDALFWLPIWLITGR